MRRAVGQKISDCWRIGGRYVLLHGIHGRIGAGKHNQNNRTVLVYENSDDLQITHLVFRAYLRGIDWGHSAYIIQRRLAFGLEYEHLSPLALFLDEAYLQESCRMEDAIEMQQKQVSNTDPMERIGTATNMPDDDSLRVLQAVGTTILLRFHCRIRI